MTSPARKLFAALTACVVLSGCDSGGGASAIPIVPIDNDAQTAAIITGSYSDNARLAFSMAEDTPLNGAFFDPSSSDPSASFTILSLPENGRIELLSGGSAFNYEPTVDFSGADTFNYSTPSGTIVSVDISITPVPDAPVLIRDFSQQANQGVLYQALLQAVDADSDELTFGSENLPDWLTLDANTGFLSGVPQVADIGVVENVRLSVIDSTGRSDATDAFDFVVIDVNDAPSMNLSQAPTELFGFQQTNFNVFPADLDNDEVEISVEPNAALSLSVTGSQINIEVSDIESVQKTELTVVARDERGAVTRETLQFTLYPRTQSEKGTTLSGYKEGRGVHIVILGDGYAADERNTFRQHVDSTLANIRSDAGIRDHLGALNIHMIETVSQQSGSDDNEQEDRVNTAFDSAYNCLSIPRLVCADILKLYEAALPEYPDVDQIILLVNDRRYGGSGNSGGRVAITSAFYPEIALHEMGHSLADLADEYVDPTIQSSFLPFQEGRFENVSTLSDPARVPWAHWIDYQSQSAGSVDLGVGVFEGGYYRTTGVYRSSLSSRMRDYGQDFGPVNTEQWILRLYTLTDGIRSFSPESTIVQGVTGEELEFSVKPIFGSAVQQVVWTLNGEVLVPEDANGSGNLTGGGAVSVVTTGANLQAIRLSLPTGQHQLSMTVSDISGRIQVQPPHAGIFNWQWSIDVL